MILAGHQRIRRLLAAVREAGPWRRLLPAGQNQPSPAASFPPRTNRSTRAGIDATDHSLCPSKGKQILHLKETQIGGLVCSCPTGFTTISDQLAGTDMRRLR